MGRERDKMTWPRLNTLITESRHKILEGRNQYVLVCTFSVPERS